MSRRGTGPFAALAVAVLTMGLLSCAHEQKLISIAVQPTDIEFGAPDTTLSFQEAAFGTYIHPPEKKDITALAVWKSNAPDIVTVTAGGLVAPGGLACGTAIVSAEVFTDNDPNGNVVVGNVNVTVDDINNPACPQPQ